MHVSDEVDFHASESLPSPVLSLSLWASCLQALPQGVDPEE